MIRRGWAKVAMVGLLVGCAVQGPATGGESRGQLPRAAWDGTFVPLSPEATNELAKAFGGQPPKAVLGLDNNGKIVVFQPYKSELPITKFPVNVGNLYEPPLNITLVTTTQSPPVTRICVPLIGGGIYCF